MVLLLKRVFSLHWALVVWYKDAFDVMLRSACHLDPKLNPESAVSSLFAARLYLIEPWPRIMDPVLFDSFCVFVFSVVFPVDVLRKRNMLVYIYIYLVIYIYIYVYCMLQHNCMLFFYDHTNHTDTSRKPLNNIAWSTCKQWLTALWCCEPWQQLWNSPTFCQQKCSISSGLFWFWRIFGLQWISRCVKMDVLVVSPFWGLIWM